MQWQKEKFPSLLQKFLNHCHIKHHLYLQGTSLLLFSTSMKMTGKFLIFQRTITAQTFLTVPVHSNFLHFETYVKIMGI
jgi:hypothetical protein